MTDTKHTPEPWDAFNINKNGPIYITSLNAGSGDICDLYHKQKDGYIFRKENCEANAERIVDCVNALEGVQNPEAIKDVVKALQAALEYFKARNMGKNAEVMEARIENALNKWENK